MDAPTQVLVAVAAIGHGCAARATCATASPKQFFAAAAEAMRRILVESARRRLAAKRGAGEDAVPLDGLDLPAPVADERPLGIHEVLDQIEAEDEIKARIVKLRFFSGMSHYEIAALLEVNEKTVRRHWALAKVWLYRAMEKRT